MEIKTIKQERFVIFNIPIPLMQDAEKDMRMFGCKVILYNYNHVKNTYGVETAKKCVGIWKDGYTLEEVADKTPKLYGTEPMGYTSVKNIYRLADGGTMEPEELCAFLVSIACRSIIPKKSKCALAYWDLLVSRALGYVAKEKGSIERIFNENNFESVCMRLRKSSKEYKERIKQRLFNDYCIGFYSKMGVRGFYITNGLTTDKAIKSFVEPVIFKSHTLSKYKKDSDEVLDHLIKLISNEKYAATENAINWARKIKLHSIYDSNPDKAKEILYKYVMKEQGNETHTTKETIQSDAVVYVDEPNIQTAKEKQDAFLMRAKLSVNR